MRRPDHRYASVVTAVETQGQPPHDPLSRELFALLNNQTVTSDVIYAYDLFTEEEHRPAVDAFLLTRSSHEEIAKVLEIDVAVITTYAHLFMDISIFRNVLEIRSFAAKYPGSEWGKEIVKTAVQVGSDYLYWMYGQKKQDYDAKMIIQHTMVDSFFRGMAHKGNSLTSGVSKEAHKWWATAIKNAELSERLNPTAGKQAFEELRIALAKQDDTKTLEEFAIPASEILH